MSYKKHFTVGALLSCLTLASGLAFAGGDSGGGGDAATEMRIDAIRADIEKWINEGGARQLKLPVSISYDDYSRGMEKFLARHAVVIGAVTWAEEEVTKNPEVSVAVAGQPKTCRSFISKKDGLPHILCNVERFAQQSEAEQYRLIHHEFAGLARLEKNIGASSDYSISSQITDFLIPETVLRLAVKKPSEPTTTQDSPRRAARRIQGVWDLRGVFGNGEILTAYDLQVEGDVRVFFNHCRSLFYLRSDNKCVTPAYPYSALHSAPQSPDKHALKMLAFNLTSWVYDSTYGGFLVHSNPNAENFAAYGVKVEESNPDVLLLETDPLGVYDKPSAGTVYSIPRLRK